MKKVFTVVLLILLGAWFYWPTSSVNVPSGILVSSEPLQSETKATPFQYKDFTITPLADFDMTARVLSKTIYHFDHESNVAPLDLALGWQMMSSTRILDKIDISQSGRFYYWHTNDFPIERSQIETESANMHMVPSTSDIEKKLKALPVNAVIHLTGYLIQISDRSGWTWQSSLTRWDTGYGACELIWVKSVDRVM